MSATKEGAVFWSISKSVRVVFVKFDTIKGFSIEDEEPLAQYYWLDHLHQLYFGSSTLSDLVSVDNSALLPLSTVTLGSQIALKSEPSFPLTIHKASKCKYTGQYILLTCTWISDNGIVFEKEFNRILLCEYSRFYGTK